MAVTPTCYLPVLSSCVLVSLIVLWMGASFLLRPVLAPPATRHSCVGAATCATGYRNESWLCSGCDTGFAAFHGQCWSCGASGSVHLGFLTWPKVNLLVLFVGLVLSIGGVAANRHRLTESLRDLKRLQVRRQGGRQKLHVQQ
jgi:hypothetical protein